MKKIGIFVVSALLSTAGFCQTVITPVATPSVISALTLTNPVVTAPADTPVVTTPVTTTPVIAPVLTTPVTTTPATAPVLTTPVTTTPATAPALSIPVTTTPGTAPVLSTPVVTPVGNKPVNTPVIFTPVTPTAVITVPEVNVPKPVSITVKGTHLYYTYSGPLVAELSFIYNYNGQKYLCHTRSHNAKHSHSDVYPTDPKIPSNVIHCNLTD